MTAYNAFGTHPALPERALDKSNLHAGKVFLVTGAAGGIGAGIVATLVAQGARVAAADLEIGRVQTATAALGDAALPLALDVSEQASITSAVAAARSWQGRLDGLVNAAAIALHAPPLEHDLDIWRRQFEVNVFGAYEVARQVAKGMIADATRGAIVNVASEAGKVGHAETMIAYSASKAAIISMSRMLSAGLAKHDINVNCVCPGSVATPMLHAVAKVYSSISGEPEGDVFDKMVSSQLKRHTTPTEVARTISFLLGDDAMLIRGQAINVDGGDTPY